MPDGRVYFRTRRGLYKLINAPTNGTMTCGPGSPRLTEGERAATLYTRREPTFHCSDFGQPCLDENGVPVVYVDPGGLRARYDWERRGQGATETTSVGAAAFRQLIAVSQGGGDDGM